MLDRGTIDAAIVILCLIAAAFALGMWVGESRVEQRLATQCIPQPGEKNGGSST